MLRRPPSYSDSFLVLPGTPGASALSPLVIPGATSERLEDSIVELPTRIGWAQKGVIVAFKGSLHILCISAFETAFYFLYVNRSENEGILNTINTYYGPLVAGCATSWSNSTRSLVEELLVAVDQSAIDTAGITAAAQRSAYNRQLLTWSSMYSMICLAVCAALGGFAQWRRWPIKWRKVFAETGLFVLVLGLYEVFFFRTIIYNYDTLSTAELNMYLVDGLARCASL
jgi:hypothetical protein